MSWRHNEAEISAHSLDNASIQASLIAASSVDARVSLGLILMWTSHWGAAADTGTVYAASTTHSLLRSCILSF